MSRRRTEYQANKKLAEMCRKADVASFWIARAIDSKDTAAFQRAIAEEQEAIAEIRQFRREQGNW